MIVVGETKRYHTPDSVREGIEKIKAELTRIVIADNFPLVYKLFSAHYPVSVLVPEKNHEKLFLAADIGVDFAKIYDPNGFTENNPRTLEVIAMVDIIGEKITRLYMNNTDILEALYQNTVEEMLKSGRFAEPMRAQK